MQDDNTMTMQEQMEMLGLPIMTLLPLQWKPTNQLSPLMAGGWQGQACVTIVSGNKNDVIVFIGGQMLRGRFFYSPIWFGTFVFLGVLVWLGGVLANLWCGTGC